MTYEVERGGIIHGNMTHKEDYNLSDDLLRRIGAYTMSWNILKITGKVLIMSWNVLKNNRIGAYNIKDGKGFWMIKKDGVEV